ncbi:MAG: hypothetical protein IMF11_18315 [Proteobacteria bacterium]|nr:hypothetical protein [Pseudomonadota bacterium]
MAELEGPDVSIEISLKEYGIAWEIGETETRFYFGTGHNGSEYIFFDQADLENSLDIYIEFDWADLLEVSQFAGLLQKDWERMPLTRKIQDLNSYYGVMNVFGESHTIPMTYEKVLENARKTE